eukprot:8583_1
MSTRNCFYCHKSFELAAFYSHLKQCTKRKTAILTRPNQDIIHIKWICSMCSFKNNLSVQTCIMCKQGVKPSKPSKPSNVSSIPTTLTWHCHSCTFINPNTSYSCKICSNPKPTNIQIAEFKSNMINPRLPPPPPPPLQLTGNTMCVCPTCSLIFLPSNTSYMRYIPNEKSPTGKLLSYKHKQHKMKFRIRCNNIKCKTIFCNGCKEIPYHIGYDCIEYAQYKTAQKCRFCQVLLTSNNKLEMQHNSSLICNSAQCMENAKLICNTQFECGHFCIGLQDEKCFGCLNPKCLPKKKEKKITVNTIDRKSVV